MDEPTQPFAVPPGGANQPDPPAAAAAAAPATAIGADAAGADSALRAQPGRTSPSYGRAGAAMPPLGPPYAAPARSAAPHLSARRRLRSGPRSRRSCRRPALVRPPSGGGGRPREPGDPRRGALLIAAIGAAAIVIVGVLAWGQSNDDSNSRFIAGAPTTTAPTDTDSQSSGTDSSSSSTDSGSSDSSASSSAEPDLADGRARHRGVRRTRARTDVQDGGRRAARHRRPARADARPATREGASFGRSSSRRCCARSG